MAAHIERGGVGGIRGGVMHPRPNIQTRLDAAFLLRAMTLQELRQTATGRGLSAKGSRRVLVARLYRDMAELDGKIRFHTGGN